MDSYLTTDDANPKAAAQSSRAQAGPAIRRRTRVERADDRTPRSRHGQGERLARALGWFSIGVGIAEVVAPQGVARLIGIEADEGNRRLLRGMGMWEIASGLAILSRRKPSFIT